MSLSDWVKNGWITEQKSSRDEIRDLLVVVERDLHDCRTAGLSSDWRFNIAYNAALQAATAALGSSRLSSCPRSSSCPRHTVARLHHRCGTAVYPQTRYFPQEAESGQLRNRWEYIRAGSQGDGRAGGRAAQSSYALAGIQASHASLRGIMNCPVCNEGTAKLVERKNYNAQYNGEPVEVPAVEVYHCPDCGEDFLNPEQSHALAVAVKNEVRKKLGLLPPERITAIREKVGLTQAELEELLCQGPKVVVRWESGKVIQNGSADTVLRLLERKPELVGALKEIEKQRFAQQRRYTPLGVECK